MSSLRIQGLVLIGALSVGARVTQAQSKAGKCPSASADTASWMRDTSRDLGIEIQHPTDYRKKRWESRSDTTGIALSFWRYAVTRIDFNEFRGIYSGEGPDRSLPPCVLQMHGASMSLYIGRSPSTLPSGRDTLYYRARGLLSLPGKPRILVELNATDSTGILEQLTILRTIRVLKGH
jgi:hypothetical protein